MYSLFFPYRPIFDLCVLREELMDYALMKAAHNTRGGALKGVYRVADAPRSCSSLSRHRAANSQLRQCAADKGLISLVYYLHNVEQLIAWCSINLLLFSSLLLRERGHSFHFHGSKNRQGNARHPAMCFGAAACACDKNIIWLHVVCVYCPVLKLSCSNQSLKICRLICLSRCSKWHAHIVTKRQCWIKSKNKSIL